MITQKFLLEYFQYEPETGLFFRKKRYGHAANPSDIPLGCPTNKKKAYLRIIIKGHHYTLHRVIWLYVTGAWPENQIDHINGIQDDNRWENLRACTNAQNTCNRTVKKDSQTGIKGVSHDKRTGRFRAYIGHNKKRINLGFFATKQEAHARRLEFSYLHGEFAKETPFALIWKD